MYLLQGSVLGSPHSAGLLSGVNAHIPSVDRFAQNHYLFPEMPMVETLERLTKPRWSHVESAANKLTAIYSAPPIPALEIAESNGVDVVFSSFGSSGDKVAGFCDFANARLYVNAEDVTERQTFTIAHELGHWILHKRYFDAHPDEYEIFPRFQSVAVSNAFEKEANSFAANLLVPKRLLKPVLHASVAHLARAFGVSQTMMEYRLKNVR